MLGSGGHGDLHLRHICLTYIYLLLSISAHFLPADIDRAHFYFTANITAPSESPPRHHKTLPPTTSPKCKHPQTSAEASTTPLALRSPWDQLYLPHHRPQSALPSHPPPRAARTSNEPYHHNVVTKAPPTATPLTSRPTKLSQTPFPWKGNGRRSSSPPFGRNTHLIG